MGATQGKFNKGRRGNCTSTLVIKQGQQKQVQMYNIFRLLIAVPDYGSESYREKQKLIGFCDKVTITPQGKSQWKITYDVCGSQAAGSWAKGRSVSPYVFHRSTESLRHR